MALSLDDRVVNGIAWLSAHDPTGRFHLWFQARVLPGTPMPTQTEDTIEAYREYHRAREQWERLWTAWERANPETARAETGGSETGPVALSGPSPVKEAVDQLSLPRA